MGMTLKTVFLNYFFSRYITAEEASGVDRAKRDVNVASVEKDIRYLIILTGPISTSLPTVLCFT